MVGMLRIPIYSGSFNAHFQDSVEKCGMSIHYKKFRPWHICGQDSDIVAGGLRTSGILVCAKSYEGGG